MKRTIKKLLSGVLTLGLIATMLPGMSMTAKAATPYTGTSSGTPAASNWNHYSDASASTAVAIGDIEALGTIEDGIAFYIKPNANYEWDGTPAVTFTVAGKVTSPTDAPVTLESDDIYRIKVPTYASSAANDIIRLNFTNVKVKAKEHEATIEFKEAGSGTAGTPTTPANGKPNETSNFVFPITLSDGMMLDASKGTNGVEVKWTKTNAATPPTDSVAVATSPNDKPTKGTVTINSSPNPIIDDITITVNTKKKMYDVTKDAAVKSTYSVGTDKVPTSGGKFEHGTAVSLQSSETKITQIKYTVTPVDIEGNPISGLTSDEQVLTGTNGKFDISSIEGNIEITKELEEPEELKVYHTTAYTPEVAKMTGSDGTEIKASDSTSEATAESGKDYKFTAEIAKGYIPSADKKTKPLTVKVTIDGVTDPLSYTDDDDNTNDTLTVSVSYPNIEVTVPGDKLVGDIEKIEVDNLVEAAVIKPGENIASVKAKDSALDIHDDEGNLLVDPDVDATVILTPEDDQIFADGAVTKTDALAISMDGEVTVPADKLTAGKDYVIDVEKENADGTKNLLPASDPGNGGQTSGEGQPEDASTPGSAGPDGANSAQPGGPGSTGFADDNLIADYAKPYVKAAADAGIIKGVGDNRFDPLGTATRAQFATMVARAKGLKASKTSSKFADVVAPLNADLINGVIACEDLNPAIVQGYPDKSFQPNKAVSRAEGILMIWRAAGSPAYSGADKFNDMADWYKDAANWGADKGIVNGVGNNQFNGNGTLTRQDLATMLGRAIEKGVITAAQAQDIADKANTEDKTDEKTDAASEGESTEASTEKTEEKAAE